MGRKITIKHAFNPRLGLRAPKIKTLTTARRPDQQNIARVATSAKPQVLYGRRHLRPSALSKNPSLSRDDV